MPSIDFKSIREQVPIDQVLDLLAYEPFSRQGDQLRGPCPVHDLQSPLAQSNRSRVFSVNLSKNAFQCFRCSAHGNQLDLWAAVHGLTIYQAAIDLTQRLGVDA